MKTAFFMLGRQSGSHTVKKAKTEKAAIAVRLIAARERAGVTKEEAAEAAGVQPAAVSAWERGTALPTLLQLKGLIQCYGVTSHQVLFGCTFLQFTGDEAIELARASRALSPPLRLKLDVLLAIADRAVSPVMTN
jgi:transcriptional regulator with XRE-family HTH domain